MKNSENPPTLLDGRCHVDDDPAATECAGEENHSTASVNGLVSLAPILAAAVRGGAAAAAAAVAAAEAHVRLLFRSDLLLW
eukprot:gene14369-biopygen9150